MDELLQLGIVPVNISVLRSLFSSYKYPNDKILSLEKEGKLIRLKKGLYVVSPKVSGLLLSVELIANHLYGPSYVSMETALDYYGLIPEHAYTIRSASLHRSKAFKNDIAYFQFVSVDEAYYPVGITQQTLHDKFTYYIASPEKALCDLIVTTQHLDAYSVKAVETYLEYDLRFEMSALEHMDKEIIRQCIDTGKKKRILKSLLKLI